MRGIALVLMLAACDEAADRPARWSYIHAAIIQPACATAGCHSKLTALAGLDLSSRDGAYNVLVGHVCGEPIRPQDPGRNYITPGSAAYSQLVYQLRGEDAAGRPYRDVMPPDSPLPEVEVELVERWIDDGAACELIVAAVVLALAGRAEAYPQFQLALGTDRCITCHFSPAGGGLINAYGRDEAGGTISHGGDGRFLHGLWEPPSWLLLGADVRLAGAVKYRDQDRELLGFPMQTDVYLRAGGERISFTMAAGLRGGARDPQPPLVERLASREHYLMYERESGSYIRAGRFFPIYGVRSQDHTAYVRRYLGFHTLEEPYGIAAGTFGSTWEAHASAFGPRPIEQLGAGVKAHGAAIYYERRFLDDTLALAGQSRFAISSTDARLAAGVVAKRWLAGAGLLVLAELDLQRQSFDGAGPTRYQLAAYAGASKFIARGVMLGAAVQRWQPDLTLRSSRDAVQLDVQYFPRAHVELHLLTRVAAEGNDLDDPGLLSLLQLHYYL